MANRVEYHGTSGGKSGDAKWWVAEESKVHEDLLPLVKRLEARQLWRHVENVRHARLYSNLTGIGLYSGIYQQALGSIANAKRVTYNVISACVDTACAKIAKAKPRPIFLTDEGNWSQQRKARKLTQFMEAHFDEIGLYPIGQDAFRDSGVFGTGAVKFFKEDGTVKAERVLISEIIVDEAEALYGSPQNLYQVRYITRDKLKAMFPKFEKDIDAAKSGLNAGTFGDYTQILKVVEAWHLPSLEGAGDGRHCIAIENATLLCEEWVHDCFPMSFLRWEPKVVGFWGMGIAEKLIGIQLEINKVAERIRKAFHLMAVPRVFLEANSQVNQAAINNSEGTIIPYLGTPPAFGTAQGMSAEGYNYLESLYNKAFQLVGISQLSAASAKPAGLNAGVALREYQDIESERFALQSQRYEAFYMDSAKIILKLMRELVNEKQNPVVPLRTKKGVQRISFKELDAIKDKYVMRVFPSSILPSTPSGKLQTVTELMQGGFIDKDQALSLLDFPDTESYFALATAELKEIQMVMDQILEGGEYQTPEPYQRPDLCVKVARMYLAKAKEDKAPETVLENIRIYIQQAMDLQSSIVQAAQEQQAAMAKPQAAPVSDLLPVGGAAG